MEIKLYQNLLYEFNFTWGSFKFIFFRQRCKFLIFCNFDRTDKSMSRIAPIRIITAAWWKGSLNYVITPSRLRNRCLQIIRTEFLFVWNESRSLLILSKTATKKIFQGMTQPTLFDAKCPYKFYPWYLYLQHLLE